MKYSQMIAIHITALLLLVVALAIYPILLTIGLLAMCVVIVVQAGVELYHWMTNV